MRGKIFTTNIYSSILELENVNYKTKQSQRAQSHTDDDKDARQTVQSPGSIFEKLAILRSWTERNASVDTISERAYLRAPEPVPATLIRVDDVLAVSLNCSDTVAREEYLLLGA